MDKQAKTEVKVPMPSISCVTLVNYLNNFDPNDATCKWADGKLTVKITGNDPASIHLQYYHPELKRNMPLRVLVDRQPIPYDIYPKGKKGQRFHREFDSATVHVFKYLGNPSVREDDKSEFFSQPDPSTLDPLFQLAERVDALLRHKVQRMIDLGDRLSKDIAAIRKEKKNGNISEQLATLPYIGEVIKARSVIISPSHKNIMDQLFIHFDKPDLSNSVTYMESPTIRYLIHDNIKDSDKKLANPIVHSKLGIIKELDTDFKKEVSMRLTQVKQDFETGEIVKGKRLAINSDNIHNYIKRGLYLTGPLSMDYVTCVKGVLNCACTWQQDVMLVSEMNSHQQEDDSDPIAAMSKQLGLKVVVTETTQPAVVIEEEISAASVAVIDNDEDYTDD